MSNYETRGHEAAFPDGLTKREYFAAMAMQGLLAHESSNSLSFEQTADAACIQADALIKALNENQPTMNTPTTKAKPTPGPIHFAKWVRENWVYNVNPVEGKRWYSPTNSKYEKYRSVATLDMLYDQIYFPEFESNETSLTPSGLVEQKKQLREVLEMVKKTIDVFGNPNANWSTKMIYESIEGVLKATE